MALRALDLKSSRHDKIFTSRNEGMAFQHVRSSQEPESKMKWFQYKKRMKLIVGCDGAEMKDVPDTPWHLHSILMLFSMICQRKETSDIGEYKALDVVV